jgi:Na+-transporting NADH:ubiquinone oxidoreductase subunit NqrC
MKDWINNRQNQVTILLVATMILTVSNFIAPAYEALSYYREQIVSLENQYQLLYRYSLHVDYHETQLKQIEQQLENLQQLYDIPRNTAAFQKHFRKIQREYHLTVVAQQTSKENASQDLEKIYIRQSLEGKYSSHMNYLKAILNEQNGILLERYILDTKAPLSKEPNLTADLQLTLFVPLK